MKSSVVICAYTLDRWNTLARAVASCAEQTRPPDEVILVIDYNDDLFQRALVEFPHVEVIANSMSKGLSGARNTGVRAARGEIIVFLDDDAWGEERWLEELLEPFNDPTVAGCGGWIVPEWQGGRPPWFPETFLWIMGCSYDGLPRSGATIRNPIGANMALRRRVFDLVGGFSAGLGRIGAVPLGCEETELCIRYGINHSRERFVMVREAVVFHSVPPSRTSWDYFFRRCWSEGLSKAAVASLVGGGAGLSAERSHLAKALPRELLSSVVELRRQPSQVARRLLGIVGGSVVTVAGFLWGSVAVRRQPITPPGSELEGAEVLDASERRWREISVVRVDLDALPGEIRIPLECDDRVWLGVARGRQVVDRRDVTSQDHVISRAQLEEIASRVGPSTSGFPDVSDELLPPISIVVPTIAKDVAELCRSIEMLSTLDYPQFEVIIVDNRVGVPDRRFLSQEHLGNVVGGVRRHPWAFRRRGIVVFVRPVSTSSPSPTTTWRWTTRGYAPRRTVALKPRDRRPRWSRTARASGDASHNSGSRSTSADSSSSFELRIANLKHHLPDDPSSPINRAGTPRVATWRCVRRRFDAVGGFRLSLGTGTPAMGGEDLEMFMAVATRGGTIAFEPSALVHHIHRSTEEQFLAQTRGYGVGLTAAYVSLIVHDPRHLVPVADAFPAWRAHVARGAPDAREPRASPPIPR